MPTILDMSCISLSPAISKAPVITSSPLKTEYAGKTALLEQLRKRHRKYLKRLKEQPSEETNKTRNCDTITHNFGSPFKMDSKDLALRIVTRTRMKMSRNPLNNKRPLLTSSPIRQQKKVPTTSFETPSGKKKPPPLSIEKLTPPLSLEYSQRYKTVQKKWQDEIHLHKKQPSPCQKLPLNVEGHKDFVPRSKSDVAHRSQISVDVTNLSPITTTCKRKLTFTDSKPTNQPALGVNVSQKKLQNNKVLECHADTKARHNVTLSKNNNETLPKRKNKQNISDSTSKNDVAEKVAQAAKLRQERINLKALQRIQIYALNAVMKEFEEANYAKELSSRESLNPPSITKI